MAGNISDRSILGRRYARALFALAVEQKQLKQVEGELAGIVELVAGSRALEDVFTSPVYKKSHVEAVVSALLKKAKFSELMANMCNLLAQNRRLALLPDIYHAFVTMAAEERGEVNAELVTASAATKAQEKSVADALKEVTGKKVKLQKIVDESIIGGLIVKVGSTMLDDSVNGRLERLRLQLKHSDMVTD